MLPLAPGLLSMMTGCPSDSDSDCERIRAMTSVLPPGAKPTTMRTGLAGQLEAGCASAVAPALARAAIARTCSRRRRMDDVGACGFLGRLARAAVSRSLNFWIFPEGVAGIASRTIRRSGMYCSATFCAFRNSTIEGKSTLWPGLVTTTAQARSPRRSSG